MFWRLRRALSVLQGKARVVMYDQSPAHALRYQYAPKLILHF